MTKEFRTLIDECRTKIINTPDEDLGGYEKILKSIYNSKYNSTFQDYLNDDLEAVTDEEGEAIAIKGNSFKE